jgi:uncharacterized protein
VVIDGGSGDGTIDLARAAGAQATLAPRGRAAQMNAGAALATGDALVFVHADVWPPPDLGQRVMSALDKHGVIAGAFTTWTELEPPGLAYAGPGRTLLSAVAHLADVRSRLTRHPYGDQALFVRRADFDALGGYPAQPILEDYELSRRLARRGRLARLSPPITVSGRRLAAAPLLTTLLWNTLPALYRLGVDPARLARLYRDQR